MRANNRLITRPLSIAICTALLMPGALRAATFLTFVDDFSTFQSTVGATTIVTTEDFSSAIDGALVGSTANPDIWNGFTVSAFGGIPPFGASKYCTDLSSGPCIVWNNSTPQVPGIYGSVGSGESTGISFKPTSNTIAGFSFDFVDWNDSNMQRSYFIIIASDGSETIVTGPANPDHMPPQNFAVTLSADDINQGKYIQEIRLVGVDPNGSEVVGFYNFRLLSNPLLATALSVLDATIRAGNHPASGAARVIDATPELLALFAAAGLSTDSEVSSAATQTLPVLAGSSQFAASSALRGINRIIQARIETNRGLSSGDEFYGDHKLWMKPFGTWTDQDDRKGVSGYEADTTGIAFGTDAVFNDTTRLGLSFTYARADVDGNSATTPANIDIDVYHLTGYGSHTVSPDTELNFQLGIGQNRNKTRRSIPFDGTSASSSYNSSTATVGLGIGRIYPLNDTTSLTPSVRADYSRIKDKAYTETGAGLLNLHVPSNTFDELILAVDGRLTHEIRQNTVLTVNLGVGYDLISDAGGIATAFAGVPGSAFSTQGLDPSPWVTRAGLGIIGTTTSGLEITGRLDMERRNDFLNQTASVKLRWAF